MDTRLPPAWGVWVVLMYFVLPQILRWFCFVVWETGMETVSGSVEAGGRKRELIFDTFLRLLWGICAQDTDCLLEILASFFSQQ